MGALGSTQLVARHNSNRSFCSVQSSGRAQYNTKMNLKVERTNSTATKDRKKDSKPCTMITILNSIWLIKVSGIAPSAVDVSFSVIYFCTVVLHDAHTQAVWEKGAAQNKTMPTQCALQVFQCITRETC